MFNIYNILSELDTDEIHKRHKKNNGASVIALMTVGKKSGKREAHLRWKRHVVIRILVLCKLLQIRNMLDKKSLAIGCPLRIRKIFKVR